MGEAKMELDFIFKGDKNLEIKLINVHDHYIKNQQRAWDNDIYTSNYWMFTRSDDFLIINDVKMFYIPNVFDNRTVTHMVFDSDFTRKRFLKNLHIALIQWSNDVYFKSEDCFTKKGNIVYDGSKWIVF